MVEERAAFATAFAGTEFRFRKRLIRTFVSRTIRERGVDDIQRYFSARISARISSVRPLASASLLISSQERRNFSTFRW